MFNLFLILPEFCFQQNNTFDINYNATYKNVFNLKLNSRLVGKKDWTMQGFSVGGSYNLINGNNKLILSYDLWQPNSAQMNQKYGLTFSSQNSFTNLNLSIFKSDGIQGGISGRLDFNMRFDH